MKFGQTKSTQYVLYAKKTVNICSLIFVWSVLIEVPDSSGSTTHAIAVWIKSKTFTESLISSLIEKN
tara:strand:+ start:426 stop:626 length:201 start_codon:yes stop_codon:yes gene_type:complete